MVHLTKMDSDQRENYPDVTSHAEQAQVFGNNYVPGIALFFIPGVELRNASAAAINPSSIIFVFAPSTRALSIEFDHAEDSLV